MNINRFQIRYMDSMFDSGPLFTADTTEAIFNFLVSSTFDESELIVKDLVDDIFVEANEFMIAFEEGECPLDLQFF